MRRLNQSEPHRRLKEAADRRELGANSLGNSITPEARERDRNNLRGILVRLVFLCCGFCRRWSYSSSQSRENLLRMTEDLQEASELERKYVHQVYTQIAPHFNHTRYKAWPKVRQFLWTLPGNSLVADIGCGNGKYCCVTHRLFVIGCDICPELAAIARAKSPNCDICLADNLSLPYRDDSFDALLSIAVIHHFATKNRREKALSEMARIVRPGGKLMIYVWALEQTQRQFSAQDVLVPWHLHTQRRGVENQGSVDSQNGNEVDPKRMLRVDQLSVADRVIGGSFGMEPLKDKQESSDPPVDSENNPADPNAEQAEAVGWTKTIAMKFDRLFSLSPRLRKKDESAPPPPVPPNFFKSTEEQESSYEENQLLHSQMSKEYLVAGVARFSPMLGRKLARVLGTPPPKLLIIESLAQKLSFDWTRDAIDEYLLLSAFAGDSTQTSDNPNIQPADQKEEGTPTFYRYYHVFKEGELDSLVSEEPSLTIAQSFYDHANWCVIAEKR